MEKTRRRGWNVDANAHSTTLLSFLSRFLTESLFVWSFHSEMGGGGKGNPRRFPLLAFGSCYPPSGWKFSLVTTLCEKVFDLLQTDELLHQALQRILALRLSLLRLL